MLPPGPVVSLSCGRGFAGQSPAWGSGSEKSGFAWQRGSGQVASAGRVQTIVVHFPAFRLAKKGHFFFFFFGAAAGRETMARAIRAPLQGRDKRVFCPVQGGVCEIFPLKCSSGGNMRRGGSLSWACRFLPGSNGPFLVFERQSARFTAGGARRGHAGLWLWWYALWFHGITSACDRGSRAGAQSRNHAASLIQTGKEREPLLYLLNRRVIFIILHFL